MTKFVGRAIALARKKKKKNLQKALQKINKFRGKREKARVHKIKLLIRACCKRPHHSAVEACWVDFRTSSRALVAVQS